LTAKKYCTAELAAAVNIAAIGTGNPNTWEVVTDNTAVVVKWACKAMTLVYKTTEH
jgi:hypothetical protein